MSPVQLFRRGPKAAAEGEGSMGVLLDLDAEPDVPVTPIRSAPPMRPRKRPARAPKPPKKPAAQKPLYVFSSVLTALSLLALTFAGTLGVVGPVRHARDQQTAFADLRSTLANATTPVTQVGADGQLYPLGTPIGVLDVPQLGMREVLLEGSSPGVLASGPGHRRDSPYPGQAGTSVVLGRQAAYGGPFKQLGTLKPGDVMTVTTGQGQHVFRVVAVRLAGDPQPPAVVAGKGRITLITAAGRPWVPEGILRVDADLVTPTQAAGPRPLTALQLPPAEKPLGTDQSGLIVIVLLGQALLLVSLVVAWARYRWGRWQVWLAGGPVLFALAVAISHQIALLLPNVM